MVHGKHDTIERNQMNTLQRVNVEKIGYDNGWENVITSNTEQVVLGSARHTMQITIMSDDAAGWHVYIPNTRWLGKFFHQYTEVPQRQGYLWATGWHELAEILRNLSIFVQSRSKDVMETFGEQVQVALTDITDNQTEVERLVKQRIGQTIFRERLMDYWGRACAVTGVDVVEILRASHIKPWADCIEDAERLDVYNGLLLVANLDALFDRALITFDDTGRLICSSCINPEQRKQLHLEQPLVLRKITPEHQQYLQWHREKFISHPIL